MFRERILPVGFLLCCLAALIHICQLNGWLPAWQITEKPEYKLLPPPDEQVELSYLTLPVTFSMEEMQRRVNEEMPTVLFDKPVTYQERRVRVRVTRTGQAKVRADEQGVIRGSVPISFRADANREGLFKPALHTTGRLTAYVDITLDVDEHWNPQIKANSRFRWRKRPIIKVFFSEIDVADIIGGEIQKLLDTQTEKLLKRLDEQFQFRSLAEKTWHALHAAVPVDKEEGIWLTVEPKRAFLEPMEGDEYDLRGKLGLLADIRLQALAQAPELTVAPLPSLEKDLPDQRSFNVQLNSEFPYETLAQIVAADIESADDVHVNGLEIYPSGARVAMALDQTFTPPVWWKQVRFRSYSAGEPMLDSEVWQFRIDAEPQTPVSIGPWRAPFGVDQNDRSPDSPIKVNLETQRSEYRERLYGYINRPLGNGLMVWSDIESMTLDTIQPGETGLVLGSTGEGQMRLLLGF